ncbi:hypothetical protein FHU37_003844 [Allostreptomyces psammosilenae]|uniref:Uncharacterized protein n=1 Tax=Allostreptomyces psammosilenae TaxID=1892865 RepID=A0A853A8D3_9ACTN|nr:hypothetical protein [Allostreptomyces psammosilenae]
MSDPAFLTVHRARRDGIDPWAPGPRFVRPYVGSLAPTEDADEWPAAEWETTLPLVLPHAAPAAPDANQRRQRGRHRRRWPWPWPWRLWARRPRR